MKKIATALSVMLIAATPFAAQATPDDDLKAFRSYFTKKFPNVPVNDFVNGVYSVDAASREQWEAFEEFPSLPDTISGSTGVGFSLQFNAFGELSDACSHHECINECLISISMNCVWTISVAFRHLQWINKRRFVIAIHCVFSNF